MAKLEAAYKKAMVDAVKAEGGYGRRIEDQYGVGILDTILILPTTGPIFAEVKRFTGMRFNPSDRQFVEMERINSGGGLSVLIGVKDDRNYFHVAAKVALVENCVIQLDDESFCDALRRWVRTQGR